MTYRLTPTYNKQLSKVPVFDYVTLIYHQPCPELGGKSRISVL